MRRSLDPITIGSWLCLVAMLALSSPGVRVVRADAPTAAGPVCEASGVRTIPGQDVSAILEHLRAAALAEAAKQPDSNGESPIALNNRGYNYGPAGSSNIGSLLQQLQRESR